MQSYAEAETWFFAYLIGPSDRHAWSVSRPGRFAHWETATPAPKQQVIKNNDNWEDQVVGGWTILKWILER
jgi:hypothetical protein